MGPYRGCSTFPIEEYLANYLSEIVLRNSHHITTYTSLKESSNDDASWGKLKSGHNNFVNLLLYLNIGYVSKT